MLVSVETIRRHCAWAKRVVALGKRLEPHATGAGPDEAFSTFRFAFDPLYAEVELQGAHFGSDLHWDVLFAERPDLREVVTAFREAVLEAIRLIFPLVPLERDWSLLERLGQATEALSNALDGAGQGTEALDGADGPGAGRDDREWVRTSHLEVYTERLGRKVFMTQIKRSAEAGHFEGRVTTNGKQKGFEVEIGGFIKWYLRTYGKLIKPE